MPQYQMNPINDFYMRNSNPYQQQLNFPPYPQPQQPAIHSKWVTSIDEARASCPDDFLSTNIFLDTSTGKIYMKRMGNDGRPQFHTYSIEEPEQQDTSDPLSEISLRLSNIENFLGGLRNESISGNAGNQQSADAAQPAASGADGPDAAAESAGLPKMAGNDKWKRRG